MKAQIDPFILDCINSRKRTQPWTHNDDWPEIYTMLSEVGAAAFAAGQQSRWIPDATPKEDGKYLVAEEWRDEIAYNTCRWRRGDWDWNSGRVIAYQPITPYKPE